MTRQQKVNWIEFIYQKNRSHDVPMPQEGDRKYLNTLTDTQISNIFERISL